MNLEIKKATKSEAKLRLSLIGVSGGGKTFTSLSIAEHLGKKILVVDTEHGSASKYADLFTFDVIELEEFAPENFIQAIRLAEKHGYDVIVLDSLSHAWMGKGGLLDIHGDEEKKTRNSFTAWKTVTPKHQALIDAIVQSKIHVIATMRAKTDYAMDTENGKTKVKSVGLAPVQRDGMEYEFDVVATLDIENNFIVQKSRCPMLSGKVFNKAGLQVAEILNVWLQGVKQTTVKLPEPIKPQMSSSVQDDIIAAEIENHNPDEIEAMAGKSNYEDEWNEAIGNIVPPKPVEQAPVTSETRGRLLAQAGHVSKEGNGYTVSETIDGKITKYKITREQGITKCTCSEYVRESRTNNQYFCAHKWALRLTVDQKQAAKV